MPQIESIERAQCGLPANVPVDVTKEIENATAGHNGKIRLPGEISINTSEICQRPPELL